MKFLKLLKILILRNIKEEKFLTSLSVLGIALGIGLFTGVKVASDRAISSFESDIKGINPYANYEILDTSGIDFDEKIYKRVRSIEGNSLPVLKTYGYIPALKDTLDINGIYTVKAFPFLKLSQSDPLPPAFPPRRIRPDAEGKEHKERFLFTRYNFEQFYKELQGIFITKKFADKYSLKKGDTLKTLIYDREYTLKIIDILDSGPLITNTAFMDLGNFQEYFDKTGYLSRIDLATDEKAVTEMNKILPPNLVIEKKAEIFRNRKALVASFRYNLQFVSLIAILAGVFLLYNTVFITVVKRRTEIGILRGLGADKKTVVLLFTIQGIVLGLIGSLLGIVFGQLAAYFSVIAVEKTISTFYSTIAISDYIISKHDAMTAIVLGVFVSFLASAVPAFESSRIRPNETSREGSFEGRYGRYQRVVSLGGILFIFLGILISSLDYWYAPFEFPFLAYTGIFLIITGFTLLSPFYLSIFLKAVKRPLEQVFGAIGKITLGDMKGNVYRFSIALMGVAISSALIIAFLTLIFSLRESLAVWINKNVAADVYIKPASCKVNYCFYPLSEHVIDTVKSFPEVEGTDKFRGMQLDLFGQKVVTAFADIGTKRKFLGRKYFDKEYDQILKEMEGSEPVAGISAYLSIKYGLKKGDFIELNSPSGIAKFRINDVFSSYATTAGFIYIDRKWLKRYWGLDDATQISIYAKKDADVAKLIRKLRGVLLPEYSIEIMNNRELRDKIMDIFNKSFAITYAIELIAIIVSLIGVINTLLALVFERKRAISIIRYLGGSWKQIQQTLILSAAIIGTTGIFLGTLLGSLMSTILIYVVNKISFGWEIHFRMPFFSLLFVTAVLFLTILFAGFLPSKVAKKIDPRKFVSFE
jgi:putative ABC transport system permease protein